MTIMTRMSRLFKADMHGLIDQLEEPDALLRQAVRDMEEEIARRDALAAAVRADAERFGQRADLLTKAIEAHGARLDLCLGSGKNELARTIVRKKLEDEKLQMAFLARAAEAAASLERQAREIAECRERLADVKRRMELFTDLPADAPDDRHPARTVAVSDDDVEIAMLEEQRRRGIKAGGQGGAS